MSQESKTPRTDAALFLVSGKTREKFVSAAFSRQLERELTAVTEERDAFMASARIREANATEIGARLSFMIESEGRVAKYPSGWQCEWICDYFDTHETACYPTAIEAIDAAIKSRDELRKAREIEPTTESDQ